MVKHLGRQQTSNTERLHSTSRGDTQPLLFVWLPGARTRAVGSAARTVALLPRSTVCVLTIREQTHEGGGLAKAAGRKFGS